MGGVSAKDLRAWDRGDYRHIGVAFEAPNHYLKLTRENLQLFAGLPRGGTRILMFSWSASDWNRTATARRRVLEGHARPPDVEAVSDGTRIECDCPVGGLADNADFLRLLRSDAVATIHTLAGAVISGLPLLLAAWLFDRRLLRRA